MPLPVRRLLLAVPPLAVAALVFAASAAADTNGGVQFPRPESPNAHRILDAYYLILYIAGAIFLVVEGALIVFIVRFRNRGRPRDAEGPQIHGATRLELMWTLVPVLIITAIVSFVFYKLPGIKDVPKAKASGGPLQIQVDAHQFYWQFEYPNGSSSIDELHVPVNRVVRVSITSHDVDHSWWIPSFSGKFDAIPGRTNHTWFKAEKAGTYPGQCGEFCGLYHAIMNARVIAESEDAYTEFTTKRAKADLGRQEWVGVCSKCHGPQGEGGFGPAISGSAVLKQRDALYTLVKNGQKLMPPVARGWSDRQLDALYKYVSTKINKSSGGGA